MKKLIAGLSLFLSFGLMSNSASAQTFETAREQYFDEIGSYEYEGQLLEPQWFRHVKKEFDTNGDGRMDSYIEWDEFWIFGVRIWQGPLTDPKSK